MIKEGKCFWRREIEGHAFFGDKPYRLFGYLCTCPHLTSLKIFK